MRLFNDGNQNDQDEAMKSSCYPEAETEQWLSRLVQASKVDKVRLLDSELKDTLRSQFLVELLDKESESCCIQDTVVDRWLQ